MHRLLNGTQAYDWGSPGAIPRFLGAPGDAQPVAEMWIGTHPLSPSRVEGLDVDLDQVAGRLPFLLKILAADRPLSLQVHPNKTQAETGYAAENAAGIPLDAAHRTYRDDNHKPEMAYALTTFETLVGFRPTAEILRILHQLDTPLGRRLSKELHADPGFPGIVRLVERLLRDGVEPGEVDAVVRECRRLADLGVDIKRAYATAAEVASHHPGDIGVVISLMLNRLTLQPGEAAFLDTGIIHAHLSGMCLEVMATSDNVLRAGLTSKHVDPEGLVATLEGGFSRLARVTPDYIDHATIVFSPKVEEFAMAVSQCSAADPAGVPLPSTGHRLLICTGGEVIVVNDHADKTVLKRGQSLYAGPDDGHLRIVGVGEVAQAYEPTGGTPTSTMVDLV